MTFIFLSTWLILFIFAIRLMSKGWRASDDAYLNKILVEEKRTVTKPMHPEMVDIKQGDELLVVRFDEPEKEMDPRFKLDSPELHNLGDPLHKSLQDRIDELQDEDEDEGGLVVRR